MNTESGGAKGVAVIVAAWGNVAVREVRGGIVARSWVLFVTVSAIMAVTLVGI